MKSQYWRISYCPSFEGCGVVEWVFKGNKDQLDKYLKDNHSCGCAACQEEDSWWFTAQSCEYNIEEITEGSD